ncbi:hypothetical protein [Murinocardiopsis flavida]|nr:hypothetical protein [Murinocardiopsis flavida]
MSDYTRTTLVAGSVELARWVEEMAPGWRCVWLPQHSEFIAYPIAGTAFDGARPAASGATAEKVLAEIGSHAQLCRVIREYLAMREVAA